MKINFTRDEVNEMIETIISWRDDTNDNSVNPLIEKLKDAIECPFE